MQSIENKVVVITGASRGIGAAMAGVFAEEGARLLLCGRDKKALGEVVDSLEHLKSQCFAVTSDITKKSGMKKIVDTAMKRFGVIDIFINNAGVGVFKPLEETSEKDYDLMFDTNLKAVYHSFMELLPRMKEQGFGHIINISSMASKQGLPNMALYSASKAALNILSEAVAGEVRNDNIKISVLAPGSTDTGFSGRTPSGASNKLTPEDVARTALQSG